MGIPDFQKLDKWEDTVVNPTEARGVVHFYYYYTSHTSFTISAKWQHVLNLFLYFHMNPVYQKDDLFPLYFHLGIITVS